MRKVIIVHRWDSTPESDWYKAVANSLEEKGLQVEIPEMPNTSEPKIESWISRLNEVIQNPTIETCFIGHSIGCQAILRYMESLKGNIKFDKIVLVAPWFNLQNLENKESERIAKPWIETPINFDKVKIHVSSMTAIFSDNDPWVSLSDKEVFKAIFNAKIIVEHNKGHFTKDDGFTDFHLVVKEVVTEE